MFIYLLTYAFSLAGSIGLRPRNATVFCLWPSSPFLSWCIPSPLFLFPCLSAKCFVAYLFSSSLGVPRDGLTGDGFWWFPECMSYPPPFSLLYFIFYGSFSRCILVLSVHFRCSIMRRHLLMKVCILFSVFCVVRHVSDP